MICDLWQKEERPFEVLISQREFASPASAMAETIAKADSGVQNGFGGHGHGHVHFPNKVSQVGELTVAVGRTRTRINSADILGCPHSD